MQNINYFELEPEDNIFHSVIADVTHRCNMECANCYIPNRNIPDMDFDKLRDCISKFPKRTEVRLIGAEPTVRKDLPELIKMIRATGNRPMLNTNGLRLANVDYTKKLSESGLRLTSISMNGADSDVLYLKTDNMMCAKRKVKALENCVKHNIFVNINCLIMKGVNEDAIPRLINMARKLDVKIVLRFRNIAQLGRYTLEKEENYSYNNLIHLIGSIAGVDSDIIKQSNVVDGYEEEHNVLFQVPNSKIWIKITDWCPPDSIIPDPNSKRRGRITENFKVAPFFEHVKINEFGY
jgi:molybdenum cofactor biosynthesis enzyme MoaA